MANDPDRYAALHKDWNMGPFFVLVDGNTGVVVDDENGVVSAVRRPGPHFFANAKAAGRVVRVATITLRGEPVDG